MSATGISTVTLCALETAHVHAQMARDFATTPDGRACLDRALVALSAAAIAEMHEGEKEGGE